jgi:hypothetical protein
MKLLRHTILRGETFNWQVWCCEICGRIESTFEVESPLDHACPNGCDKGEKVRQGIGDIPGAADPPPFVSE